MKKFCQFFVIAAVFMLLFPPESHADKNQIYTRGWIGGQYLEAKECFLAKKFPPERTDVIYVLPDEIQEEYSGGIFVGRVFNNTPAAVGGLKEGDLIVKINDRKVPDFDSFYSIIDAADPGSKLTITAFRDGKIMDHTVLTGKESYKKVGHFNIGLGFGSDLDLVPNPDFSLFSVISFKLNKKRLELNSPDFKYYQENLDARSKNAQYVLHRSDGWNLRVMPFGIGRDVIVVAQETL